MNGIRCSLIVLAVFMSPYLHAQSQDPRLYILKKEAIYPSPDDPLYALGAENDADSISPDFTIPKFFDVLTTDRIYYKGKCYRPMLSPLHGRVDGYDKFYPFLPAIAEQFGPGGGRTDKRYYLVWLLDNDRLYLANVKTDSRMRGHTQEEMNAMMEQYLGARFKKNIPVGDSSGLDLRFGLMPADWLDGSIFVRQQFDAKPEEQGDKWGRYQEWENSPFQQLIFEKGRLRGVINRENVR